MRIAPEGRQIILVVLALAAVLAVAGAAMPAPWHYLFFLLAAAVVGFTLFFFRDPDRAPHPGAGSGAILSPADGTVISISSVIDALYLKGEATLISIFLSPLDVHVNRIPADGTIEYEDYIPGDYLVAWHPKASELNERSILGLRHPTGTRILFKQIAGFVARRIVYHVKKGDAVFAGQRYGIVKFGSRMDVLVPPEVKIAVAVHDKVKGGLSVLGWIPDADTVEHETADESADAHE